MLGCETLSFCVCCAGGETLTPTVTNAKTWTKGRGNGHLLKESDMGQRVACIDNCVFLQF